MVLEILIDFKHPPKRVVPSNRGMSSFILFCVAGIGKKVGVGGVAVEDEKGDEARWSIRASNF